MTGATYIDFDTARTKGLSLIRSKENPIAGLLIIVGIHTGLRISDLLDLSFCQLRQNKLTIIEKKTKKKREMELNDTIKTAMSYFPKEDYPDNFHAFRSQKNTVYSNKHVNRLLSKYFTGDRISSHSLRKTFGRRVYTINGESEKALLYLSELFAHKDIATTRIYLGIRQEELNDIYMNL